MTGRNGRSATAPAIAGSGTELQPMTGRRSVSGNIVANLLGQAVVAVVTVLFVPTYIRYLGMEAFGLIGVFTTLQVIMSLFDGGMSPTLNREMARYTSGALALQDLANLLRSVEIIVGGLALLIMAGIGISAGVVSHSLLNLQSLSPTTAQTAVALIGLVVAIRFVEGIYRSALLGLQLQIWFNAANAASNTIRFGGAAIVVALISHTIEAFFLWHAAISLVSVLVLRTKLYQSLPVAPRPPQFSLESLKSIRKFAIGIFSVNILAVLLGQIDKVLLIRILPLAEFGTYTLAITICSGLLILSVAINQAVLPVLVELVSKGERAHLAATYHRTSQIVVAIIAPVAALLIFFPSDILVLWSGDVALAERTAVLVRLIAIGNLANGIMVLPYFAMVAHGWTRLSMLTNVVATLMLIPALLLLVPAFGTIGAAAVWVALNVGYIIVQAPLMHRQILKGELREWYRTGVLLPLVAAAALGALLADLRCGLAIPRLGLVVSLALTWAIVSAAVLGTLPHLRARLRDQLPRRLRA